MLGCFSRLRRPAPAGAAPAPMAQSDEASTSSTSAGGAASTAETSPCSSSSSVRCKDLSGGGEVHRHRRHAVEEDDVDGGGGGAVAKNPSALSDSGLSSAIASRRFFLSSPGRSNSIVDSSAHGGPAVGVVGAAGVAVPTYSPDPHADFLTSMEEMVAALRLDARRRRDRARLHELLLCYLALNDRRAHKYVVSAFTDLLLRLTAAANLDDDEPPRHLHQSH
ncbi:transcription repressor OFP15-like [Oryza brachyantha]|uniref:transcription repressor OFP15-like n=1 Tax=Oryza brachyantha TaxID=4533 RepID=UPI001ADC5C41|nr:transcription repressor OFP15-like [Oryza brachyantha]